MKEVQDTVFKVTILNKNKGYKTSVYGNYSDTVWNAFDSPLLLQVSILLTFSIHKAFFCVVFGINSTENAQRFLKLSQQVL